MTLRFIGEVAIRVIAIAVAAVSAYWVTTLLIS